MKNKIIEFYNKENSLVQCLICGFIFKPLLKKNEKIDINNLQCPLGCQVESNISK